MSSVMMTMTDHSDIISSTHSCETRYLRSLQCCASRSGLLSVHHQHGNQNHQPVVFRVTPECN